LENRKIFDAKAVKLISYSKTIVEEEMKMVTTIQLSEELKQKIGALKRKDSETYEDVIARLVDKQDYERKVKEYYRKYGTEISKEEKEWMEFDLELVEPEDYEKKYGNRKKK